MTSELYLKNQSQQLKNEYLFELFYYPEKRQTKNIRKRILSERAIQGIIRRKRESKEAGKGFGAQFLDLDKPSYTISARFWKDGYDALVKYSDTEIRRLTVVELKRIQTIPENFIIEGSYKDVVSQIGNAVACKFADVIL